jgi:hypothetical protein
MDLLECGLYQGQRVVLCAAVDMPTDKPLCLPLSC